MDSSLLAHPFGLSQIPGDPSFRDSAVNTVAIVPLLSSNREGEVSSTNSAHSFSDLLDALRRHTGHCSASFESDLLLVVPNSSLTRPGDWRYNDTPLKTFHWQHGCQRLRIFDGRPEHSRPAHDRLINHTVTRDWIDLCPSRRTAAVIGVLNMHDCKDIAGLHRAEEELHKWAENYATPPYEVTAHGGSASRDQPVQRLFVYDSFDEECQKIDLSKSNMGSSILAFPPTDEAHAQMMDLHLNVVINDLAVAIFRDLESKIRDSDTISTANLTQAPASRRPFTRIISGASSSASMEEPVSPSNLAVSSMAGLVSADNILAKESSDSMEASEASETTGASASDASAIAPTDNSTHEKPPKPSSPSMPLLLTPLDEYWEPSELVGRDVDSIRKRDTGRREKYAADLSLLAGSPLDAYERYLKAAELCKSGTLDPLWYAASLEGCAAAHIAMAEAGGYSVDDYLENNFQLPDEFMAVVKRNAKEDKNAKQTAKQTMLQVVHALCEEALNIVNRHAKLSAYHAELLLKLAWYNSDAAESHLRCRWGEGDGSYAGEQGDVPRWEKASVFSLKVDDAKLKDSNPVVAQTLVRTQKVCELLQQASSLSMLDPGTRVDVAAQAIRICLKGIQPTRWADGPTDRVVLPRKAAFFSTIAAETVSDGPSKNAGDLWLLATKLYSRKPGRTYGWGVLRAACLSALSAKGSNALGLEASEHLLALLGELSPDLEDEDLTQEDEVDEHAPSRHSEGADENDPSVDPNANDSKTDEGDATQALSSKANLFAKQLREGFNTLTSSSTFLAQQSKWTYDDPLDPLAVPLGESSPLVSSVTTLKCVWTNSDRTRCSAAQSQCMNRIAVLRRSVPTSTSSTKDFSVIYAAEDAPALPLFVAGAEVVQVDGRLALEKVNSAKKNNSDQDGAMATFFNPYESKRKAGGAKCVNNVTEEDERVISIKFGNSLAVPLEIQGCQLVFSGDESGRVESNAVSFDIPPNATEFPVSFPYTVAAKPAPVSDEKGDEFDVKGVNFTCLGRSMFLPVALGVPSQEKHGSVSIPTPASEYTHGTLNGNAGAVELDAIHRIHAYPCQPRLEVRFTDSRIPVEVLQVDLADGALFTSPPLLLESSGGPSALGTVKDLQVGVDGVPGLTKRLFDVNASASKSLSDQEFMAEAVENGSAPLKVRVLADQLTLDGINGTTDETGQNRLRIQVVSSYDMSKKLPSNIVLQFRVRYRGEPTSSVQVWRTREFSFRIKSVGGPRIASISFMPDLDKKCFFSALTAELRMKHLGKNKIIEEDCSINEAHQHEGMTNPMHGIGQCSSVNVCDEDVGLLVTVSNDTRLRIELSKNSGPVGGVEGMPMDTVVLRPSVTTTIPMIVKRIARADTDRTINDIVEELVAGTKLVWRSLDETGEQACGHVRIQPECLIGLVQRYPSILSKVCEAPCAVHVLVNQSASSAVPMKLAPGSPGVEVSVTLEVASWVPQDERDSCTVTTELLCVRDKHSEYGDQHPRRDHIWAGKLRHKVEMSSDQSFAHRAHVVFCAPGNYVVSACARISRKDPTTEGTEEIWWAPIAQRIVVETGKSPAQ